jgi:hypothetical protein
MGYNLLKWTYENIMKTDVKRKKNRQPAFAGVGDSYTTHKLPTASCGAPLK